MRVLSSWPYTDTASSSWHTQKRNNQTSAATVIEPNNPRVWSAQFSKAMRNEINGTNYDTQDKGK